MKLLARILSLCLVLSFLVTACGNAGSDLNTEVAGTQNSTMLEMPVVGTETTDTTEGEEVVAEPTLTPEEQEQIDWENALMADVEDALNVREEADTEADLAGKLEKGDKATVLEKGDEWTKIESGDLVGYVKNEYCVYGADALAYAKENCDMVAISIAEGLRIRQEMNTESKIMKRLEEGDKVVVDKTATVEDGWVAVIYKDKTCYVSAEFVTVTLDVGTGMTMEEIEEIRRQEEAAKKEETGGGGGGTSDPGSGDSGNIAKEVDDLTLMAAIIYCEAGAENYDAQLAVGAVIMNRVKSVGYPNTLYDVIYQRGQFGPARTGKLERVIRQGKATSSCYTAAQEALNGVDNTGGCLFFNDYNGTREGIRFGGMVFW